LWVEHPKFLPPEIAARLDWRAGEDRGRIYRIVPESPSAATAKTPFNPPQSVEDSVALIADSNGWRQFLGQRLLVEQQAKQAAPSVRKLLDEKQSATTRLHALWTLDGLSSLQPSDVIMAMDDAHVNVRVDALKLSEPWLDKPDMIRAVLARASDEDVRVRFQVALTLAGSDSSDATDVLASLALRDGHDRSFASGLLTSAKNRSGAILASLISSSEFVAAGDAQRIELVKRIASIIGARGDLDELAGLFRLLSADESTGDWWRAAAISGLGQGLPRHRGDLGRLTLAKLQSKPPEGLADSIEVLKQLFKRNEQVARNPKRAVADRAAAIELLAYQPFAEAADGLQELLSNHQPTEVQIAAINALSTHGSTAAAKIALDQWSELGPAVRGTALNLLLRRVDSTRLALDAMAAGKMHASALSIDQRVRLLKHSDQAIRDQATELFGGAVSSNRQQVAKDYEESLSLKATAAEGEKVFTRICANCHRINGKGHDAGPDLSDVRNRSKPALLYDILDPNSKVEPRFTAYTVLTIDGVIYNGLVESETSDAVVLKMAEGKRQTIGRAQIEQIKVSNVSLMPEGVEKDVTPQQMADLLEYLKKRG
jgi:putative heme-binding domain-containing protein